MRAALLSMTKMEDSPTAQSLLLTGWRTNRDAANCLGAYFSNISDENDLHRSIHTIYKTEVTKYNREPFLRVIQSLYRKHDSQKEFLREMAFEIVAEELAKNPSIASELNYFNQNNKEFMKDALRFRLRKK